MALSVFKAYDIRGIYPTELDDRFAYALGRALVLHLKAKRLIIGRDVRFASPPLHDAFLAGVLDAGCDVQDIGICSTPMLYYAARKCDAVMITASHTPGVYDGFKICRKGAIPIGSDSGLMDIETLMQHGDFPAAATRGTRFPLDITAGYVKDVLSYAVGIKHIKVVVDAGNGAAGIILPAIARRLPLALVPLFFRQDGAFPGRGPNPMLPGALDALKQRVVREKAALGAAYDADCDRIFFVDEQGQEVRPDLVTALLAERLLASHRGAPVVYDLRSSHAVPEHITACGGKPLITRVGHSFIKELMRGHKAIFAGELSGHYYYATNSYADSGDITLMLLLSLLSSTGKSLSALIAPLRRYAGSGEINFTVKDKDALLAALKKRYADGRIRELDGVTVEYDDWWFNARPSNTEPLLRLNVEAKDAALLAAKVKELREAMG